MPTYKPYVYRSQGATEMTIASSGMLAVEAGGNINIEAGGALQIAGVDFITTGGSMVMPVETLTTATPALATHGISFLTGSGLGTTGAQFTMAAAAAAGQIKIIQAGSCANSSTPTRVTLTGTLCGANTLITFSTGGVNRQYIFLVAQNTTSWLVASMSTDCAIA